MFANSNNGRSDVTLKRMSCAKSLTFVHLNLAAHPIINRFEILVLTTFNNLNTF